VSLLWRPMRSVRVERAVSKPLISTRLLKTLELVSDVVIYRCVYTENDNKDKISRDPAEGKAIPEWSNRKVTICGL
jgi:hypothetical protein